MRHLLHAVVAVFAAYVLAVLILSILYLFIPPATPLMVVDGIAHRGLRREWVPLAQINPAMQRAVIVSEDSRFCTHRGIDWRAVDKAMGEKRRGGPRGASTITMQVAKNLFLWNGRSVVRKAVEVPLALWIDALWPKRRILEVYLNIAEWGPGVFGIEAAAKREFGLSARDLNAQQAALLVTMLPNPTQRSARHPGPKQQEMAVALQARIAREGANRACLALAR
jgi:monofunctional biosynthetic peptidoglycan transglycosylase